MSFGGSNPSIEAIAYRAPIFLHIIVATCLKENEASSGMFNKHPVDNHLYSFVRRIGIGRRTSCTPSK